MKNDSLDKDNLLRTENMDVEEAQGSAKVENDKQKNTEHIEQENEELLGSVTTTHFPGLRTSARFIKKKREDQPRPTTPTNGREISSTSGRGVQRTPSQVRNSKSSWTNLERNHFFDALHEYGKDYEAIGNYINVKLKRRCSTDTCFKTKDQVRQHYYQTFHKLCKYMRFSDEIKKPVQELYALINYGEMRRKLQFVPDKHLMKLKHLVYQGHTTVRFKGKSIRIKTPSCKALRRINHLDDSLDDVKLPAKIDVIISPSSMEAFGRVQCNAQNPRVRTTVPLNKKLINFIKTFQYKWRSAEAKLAEEEAKMNAANQAAEKETSDSNNKEETTNNNSNSPNIPPPQLKDGEICFTPKPNVTLHRPLLSITDYLSTGNICLSAYEERLGVKVRGESLILEKYSNANNCKRMRTMSDSDKRSPEMKKYKLLQNSTIASMPTANETIDSSGDEDLADEINELLAEPEGMELADDNIELQAMTINSLPESVPESNSKNLKEEPRSSCIDIPETKPSVNKRGLNANHPKSYKPLLDEETIKRIHQGWTLSSAGDITVGDLYVVLGSEGRLELQYYWKDPELLNNNPPITSVINEKHTTLPYNPQETENHDYVKTVTSSNTTSNRLKHLLLIANLSERMRRKHCSCGHVCERSNVRNRTYISPKVFVQNANAANGGGNESGVFRQPLVPARRAICNMDPVKQLNSFQLSKSQKSARQGLVQRMLLPTMGHQPQDVPQTALVGASMPSLDMDLEDMITTKSAKNDCEASLKINFDEIVTSNIESTLKSSITKQNMITVTTAKAPENHNHNSFLGAFLANNMSSNSEKQPAHLNDLSRSDSEKSKICSLSNSSLDENSTSSTLSIFNSIISPMHLVRDNSSNSRWLEENLNDFSLTSLLGHLDEITSGNKDLVDSSCNLSVISETSVDYRYKFQEASAMIQNQDPE